MVPQWKPYLKHITIAYGTKLMNGSTVEPYLKHITIAYGTKLMNGSTVETLFKTYNNCVRYKIDEWFHSGNLI